MVKVPLESKSHDPLLSLLLQLKFKRLLLTYKRRHDETEKKILMKLNQNFNIELLTPPLVNLKEIQSYDLYAFLITPKE